MLSENTAAATSNDFSVLLGTFS